MEIETDGEGGSVETRRTPGERVKESETDTAYPIYLYHDEHARKGMKFMSNNLPRGVTMNEDGECEGAGWVESPTLLPSYQGEETILTAQERFGLRAPETVVHDLFLFRLKGGAIESRKFRSDAMPEGNEWQESPEEARAAAEMETEADDETGSEDPDDDDPDKALDPTEFADLDEFMTAYLDATITEDMAPTEKGAIKKAGMAQYARVRLGLEVDTNLRLSEMADAIMSAEA